jgi:hypothetical protein
MYVHTTMGTMQVPLVCFFNAQMARDVVGQYLDMEDPRIKCQGWMAQVNATLGSVQEGLILALRQGGYPAALSNRYKCANIAIAPCKQGAPWSAIVTYFFKGPDYIHPVMTFWPESLVRRSVCGICPTCDPEGKRQAEAQRAAAEAAEMAAKIQQEVRAAQPEPQPAPPPAEAPAGGEGGTST